MKKIALLLSLVLMLESARAQVSHQLFDEILKTYVNENGWVDYKKLKANRSQLTEYLNVLKNHHPEETWSRNEKLAYWINAYNAFTLELIVEKYPVESIKDIGSWLQIPFVNTPWDIKFIEISDEKYDLNNIEHDILRDELNEPRIHFAIVCASYSCPKLSRDAFVPEKIQEQLDVAAVSFLNDPKRNQMDKQNPKVSKIFSWFGGDFKKETSLIGYLNKYSNVKISEGADVDFLDYDWRLNDQATLD
ncbi:MAG: DUF547 domain-containing protein [Cyclobacteriaceae bacterium]